MADTLPESWVFACAELPALGDLCAAIAKACPDDEERFRWQRRARAVEAAMRVLGVGCPAPNSATFEIGLDPMGRR